MSDRPPLKAVPAVCSMPGCPLPVYANGLCQPHHVRETRRKVGR